MACVMCGKISIGKRCQRCLKRIKTALHVPKKRKVKVEKDKARPNITTQPESTQPADTSQASVVELSPVAGVRQVADNTAADEQAESVARPRPEWHPEPEVEEDPFTHKDLPRHYFQREGKSTVKAIMPERRKAIA